MFKSSLIYLAKAVAFGLVMAAVFILFTHFTGNQNGGLLQFGNGSSELSFASAVRKAAPAVVNIYSLSVNQDQPLNSSKLQGLGSGVIMSKEGYIITNYHVINKADEIVVAVQDGRKFSADVVGMDPETDLAVLKIEGENLPVVPINLKHSPRVGDVVLAIGNPYNLGQTITQGIISATGRSGLSSRYLDFLQTDAAINAGNSGGALIDTTGSLIGINTAAYQLTNDDKAGHGINFAIPIELAYKVMGKLIKDGRVIRGALGISGEPVNQVIAQILNLPDLKGIFVTNLDAGGPAAKAGLKPRDVIIKYQNEDVTGVEMMMDRIAETKPGTKVDVQIIRDGKTMDIPVIMGEKTSRDN